MRIMVTGGAGFIGSHIVDYAIAEGHEVLIVDDLSRGYEKNINPKAKFVKCDISSEALEEVFRTFKPEVVIHHAAQIDVQCSIKQPMHDAKVNVLGTINILECMRKYGAKKIIYPSSAAIYGNPQYLPVDEKHPVQPLSPYGITKYVPEHYYKVYSELYGIKYTIFRYANVYGIRQSSKGEGGVVSIFLDKFKAGEIPLIHGDGEQTRDFVYVKDIARANMFAINHADNETINISTNTRITINELYNIMSGFWGFDKEVTHGPERPGDILHSYLDNTRAKKILNWEPTYDIRTGLKETIEYNKN